MQASLLRNLTLFIFDLDGVLLVGKERVQYLSGRKVIAELKRRGKKVFVVTNTSTHRQEAVYRHLRTFNFQIEPHEVLTSVRLVALYLKKKYGRARCFPIGEKGLLDELRAAGHMITDKQVHAVVVGLDRKLTYSKLNRAFWILKESAELVASYGGTVYMDRHPQLSIGPIVASLEVASGKRATVIGKPAPLMFTMAMRMARAAPRKSMMVGDQLETDIIGAKKLGMRTALVLTGVETRKSLFNSKIKPDFVVRNADSLLSHL